ncbi:MAG: hypothetical protein HYV63_25480 [Candidatus Schekmanbacteria bacterium]|nr:hypothetical protein [Candidatus Schekmanbacteria bacterium]
MSSKVRFQVFAQAFMVALGVMAAAGAGAEESSPAVSVDAAVFSSYLWRGQVLNDEAALQPALTVSKSGLSINLWHSMDLTSRADAKGDFSEMDLTLAYGRSFDAVGINGGLAYYTFPGPGKGAQGIEAFLSLSAAVPASPAVAVYYGFNGLQGVYASLSLGHSFSFSEKYGLALGVTAGYGTDKYNKLYFGVDENRMNDVTASATFSAGVTDALTVKPILQYTVLVDDKIADGGTAIYGDDSKFAGGIALSYSL